MRKLFALLFVLLAVSLTASVLFFSPAAAADENEPQPGAPLLPTDALPALDSAWREALAAVVAADGAYLPDPAPYVVTALDTYADTYAGGSAGARDEWALAVIVPAAVVAAGWENLDLDQLVDVLLVRSAEGGVRGHVRTHPAFWELARRVPKELIDYGPLLAAAALGPSAQREEMTYRFPWTAGQTWWFGGSWHTGYGPNAIDFGPLTEEDPPVNSAVLAAAGGTLRMACQADQEQRLLWIEHPNGERTGYLHLDRASVAAAVENQGRVGQVAPQGTFLGVVYRGNAKTDGQCPAGFPNCTFNTLCGYGNAPHLHFVAPSRSIRIDGYNIDDIGHGAAGSRFTSSNVRDGSTVDTQAPTAWVTEPISGSVTVSPREDRLQVTVTAIDAPPAAPEADQASSSAPARPSGVAGVSVQLAYQDADGAWHSSPWQAAAPAGTDTYVATVTTCTPGLRVPHNRPVRLSLRAADKAGNETQVAEAELFRFDYPDVDGDCIVSLRDLADVTAAIAGRFPAESAAAHGYDVDGDDQLTTGDAAALLARLWEAADAAGLLGSGGCGMKSAGSCSPASCGLDKDEAICTAAPPAAPLPGSKRIVFAPLAEPGELSVAQGVAVTGTAAYVTDWRGGGLAAVDLPPGTAVTPTLSSRLTLGDRVYAVTAARDLAYVADLQAAGGRLWLLSTAQPLTPTVVASVTVPGEPLGAVAVSGVVSDLVYVAAGTSGLHVIDASAPQTPTVLGALDTPGSATALSVIDHPSGRRLALVAARSAGLLVVDVQDPGRPQALAALAMPGAALGVTAVSGSQVIAYVAAGLGGVQIVDVTTAAEPRIVGSYATGSAVSGAALAGTTLYAAAGWQGVIALDVTNPHAPRLAGAYDTPGYAFGVQPAEGRLYVADGTAGLRILQVAAEEGAPNAIFAPLAGRSIAP